MKTLGIGLPCVRQHFPYPPPHLPSTRVQPFRVHARRSRCRRYLHFSQVCQEHRTGVPKTLRCNDSALQIIRGDIFRKTGSDRRTEKVNNPFAPSRLLCVDISVLLYSLFDTVENALRSAVEAGKGRSDLADDAFATAEEQLDQYTLRYHAREQDVLGDVHDIIEDAAQKDSQIMKTYNRLSSRLGLSKADTPRSSSLVKVRFQILHSPTDRHLAPIVTCELGPEVNVSELLWTFSRLPEDQRVTLKQNPHFYLSRDLSDRPDNYDDKFVLKPLKDLKPEKDLVVLILSDRNGQIYFDYEKFSKTYGNIWKPHDAIILKGNIGSRESNKSQDRWRSMHLAKGW
ncbi:hypothetical protein EDB84DRAFT_221640 [Lactarius hengduanensis]|nr:hypothetical protein EDB84DRAFT_221640 [Lactarius hengduanensis]